MGFVQHDAIVVTTWDQKLAHRLFRTTGRCGLRTTNTTFSHMNGYVSFLVAPSGSNAGWDEAERHAAGRDAFIACLKAERFEDGSSPVEWCEVAYGSDPRTARVERHEWEDK